MGHRSRPQPRLHIFVRGRVPTEELHGRAWAEPWKPSTGPTDRSQMIKRMDAVLMVKARESHRSIPFNDDGEAPIMFRVKKPKKVFFR